MRSKIVYLPLDERPCNYDYPAHLGAIAGIPLLAPPSELMGHFKCAAQTDALWDWLFANASDATHLVASMDLLIYGGIVPSRLHQLSRATCDERIARMRRLKSEFPHLKLCECRRKCLFHLWMQVGCSRRRRRHCGSARFRSARHAAACAAPKQQSAAHAPF